MNTFFDSRSLSSAAALSALKDTDTSSNILLESSDYINDEHGSGSIQREARGIPVASRC